MSEMGRTLLFQSDDDPTVEQLVRAIRLDLEGMVSGGAQAVIEERNESLRNVMDEATKFATQCFITQQRTQIEALHNRIAQVFTTMPALPQFEDENSISTAAARVEGFLSSLGGLEVALGHSVPPIGAKAVMFRGERPPETAWETSLRDSNRLVFFGKDSGGLLKRPERMRLFLNKLNVDHGTPQVVIYVLSENSSYYTRQRSNAVRASAVRLERESRRRALMKLQELKSELTLTSRHGGRLQIVEYEDSGDELISFTHFSGGPAPDRVIFAEYDEAVDSPHTVELEFIPERFMGQAVIDTFERKRKALSLPDPSGGS